jgi:hypothetical protein
VRGGWAFWNGAPVASAALAALRAVLAPYRIELRPDLPPFRGSAIGYAAYAGAAEWPYQGHGAGDPVRKGIPLWTMPAAHGSCIRPLITAGEP